MTRSGLSLALLCLLTTSACSKRVISLQNLACESQDDCVEGWTCNPQEGVCEQTGACSTTGTMSDCARCGDDCSALDNVSAARCEVDGAGHACVIDGCESGWIDENGEVGDGCESACTQTNGGVEACDGVDNDCNGEIDNGFNLGADCGSGECAGGLTVCRADGTGATCSTDGTPCADGECNECNGGTCGESPVGLPGPGCDAAAAGECDFADTCDTGGTCNANIGGIGDACGDGECNECDASGACVESAPGSSGPGCNDVTDDDCTAPDSCAAGGMCERNHNADGTPCADDVCNECASGVCQDSPTGSPGPGCTDTTDTDCTNPETCGPGGACNTNDEPDGIVCGDGECNQCSGGACAESPNGAPGPGCTGSVSACAGVENCSNGSCISTNPPDGTSCDADGDSNFCDDSCQGGNCEAGTAADNGEPCTDGNFCNGTESCDNGSCANSTGDPCVANVGDADDDCSESCNEGSNDCTSNDPDASACDNGDYCDGDESCTAGVCGSSTGDPCLSRVGDDDTDCSESCDEGNNDCILSDPNGSFCDNGDFCDGAESCDGGTCGNSTGNPCPGDDDGPACDDSCDEGADDCFGNDTGGTPCDDGTYCNGAETCNGGGVCGNSVNPPCPGTDIPPDCNDSCNEAARNCMGTDADGTGCDDGTFCNGDETCTGGVCGNSTNPPCPETDIGPDCDDSCNETAGDCTGNDADGTGCDNGTFCDGVEICTAGVCGNSTNPPCPLTDIGPDCDDSCNETDQDCTAFDAAGTNCNDGYDCTNPTGSDSCDDAGLCGGGAFDDGYCDGLASGDLCWPPCSADSSGCVTPPASMALACTSPVTVDSLSNCTTTLTGGDSTGQSACLPCYAEVGVKELDFTDFDDGTGSCGLDGWTVRSGNFCHSDGDQCPMASLNNRTCCTNNYCPADGINGELAFQADKAECGDEQWRLQKQFNTTGLTDIRVCFDYAGDNATSNEVLQIDIFNGATYIPNVFCDVGGPRSGFNDAWIHQCVDLPAAADDRAILNIIFFLQSNDDDDRIAIDNIRVTGWGGGCGEDIVTVLSDNFDGCDLSGWVGMGVPPCPGETSCDGSDNLWVENGSWAITRFVDASALDGQVELCFDVFDDGAGDGEALEVEFSTDGTTWQTAWINLGSLGTDDVCSQVCTNLSAIDPAVHNNPALGVRFALRSGSNDDELSLDNVILRGAQYCLADPAVVALSRPPGEVGFGDYSFTASDAYGEPLAADVACYWEPDPTVTAKDTVHFDP